MSPTDREFDWLKERLDHIEEKLNTVLDERAQRRGVMRALGAVAAFSGATSLASVVALVGGLWQRLTGVSH